MKKYKKYIWGDLIISYKQGAIRSNNELGDGNVYYLKMGDLDGNGGYSTANLAKTHATSNELKQYKLNKGDFLINVRNSKEIVGKSCVIENIPVNTIFNHMLVRIIHKDNITATYVNAWLNTPWMKRYIDGIKTGTTTIIALYQADLFRVPFFLPPKQTVNAVSSFIELINKKIELNKLVNQNLEAMAKQLYDYWFVQFDFPNEKGKPYKSSGGKMVWNEKLKREIPEGWKVTTLGQFANVKKGSLITEAESNQGNVKVVAAGISFSYFNDKPNRNANVITISGSGANAGYINFWKEPIFASDCTTVQSEKDIDTIICFFNLQFYQSYLMKNASGSAQPHVYPNQVSDIPIVIIPQTLKSLIEKQFISINKRIANNDKQIASLTKQRDELLPLLMNGQVSVNGD